MYAPTAAYEAPCSWVNKSKQQYRLCKSDPGMANVLLNARKLALHNCEEQFRYNRWNCTRTRKLFKNVYRETALLYAMAASALTHSVARACARHKLSNCNCAKENQDKEYTEAWRWGKCGDNTRYARQFTRKFLQIGYVKDIHSMVHKKNIELGIHTVINGVKKKCKCQGISGSCSLKICWKEVQPFGKIASFLKEKYLRALLAEIANESTSTARIKTKKDRNLYYLGKSPSFCKSTPGRRCLNSNNCSILCCGRGYDTVLTNKTVKCNWRWAESCCYEIKYDNCTDFKNMYYCK